MIRTTLITLALLAVLFALPACNAVKGLGKDLHDGTQNVQHWMEGSGENSTYVEPQPPANRYSSRD